MIFLDWEAVGNNRLFQGISEAELKRMLGCAKFQYKMYHKGDGRMNLLKIFMYC